MLGSATLPAIYTAPLPDAQRVFLESHTSAAIKPLCLLGIRSFIILTIALLVITKIRWPAIPPTKYPIYKHHSLIAKVQQIVLITSALTSYFCVEFYYRHSRATIAPFVIALIGLGVLFTTAFISILKAESMDDSTGSSRKRIWRGRKAVRTSLSLYLACSLFWLALFVMGYFPD